MCDWTLCRCNKQLQLLRVLLQTFLNSFQQAQKAIVHAAAGAAEAAKHNMQEAYQKAVKLSLDIKLQVLQFTSTFEFMNCVLLVCLFSVLDVNNYYLFLTWFILHPILLLLFW
jgi:hypothetical protein